MEMRCKKCGYDLRGQEVFRCPECETEFRPDDPATYLTTPVSGRGYAMRVVVGFILLVIPLLVVNEDTIEAVPTSWRFIIILGPIMIVGGFSLAGDAAFRSYKALSGRVPWIIHRAGFWFAMIFGGILYLGALGYVALKGLSLIFG